MTRSPALHSASAAAATFAALLFGGCIVHTPIGGEHCVREDGRTFSPGDTFPSADGCNTCSCGADGRIACTLRACLGDGGLPDGGGGGCVTPDGRHVTPGTSFPSADGCNTCTCNAGGTIACTERACADAGPMPDVPPPPPDGGHTCTSARDCGPGQMCAGPAGCGVPWTCQTATACTADESPFCSCRGVTVFGSSSCPPEPYAHRGACDDAGPPPPPPDGGHTCTTARDCGPSEACAGPAGCGVPWTCQPSTPCTADATPYCTCRGVTVYGSSSCPPEPYAHRGACTDPPPPPPDGGAGGCMRTGCSGQICADHDVITTCEYRPEYACYDSARCERQPDGTCNWTDTPELRACLAGGGTGGGSDGGGAPFCATALCAPGLYCCESLRTCLDPRDPVVCPPSP